MNIDLEQGRIVNANDSHMPTRATFDRFAASDTFSWYRTSMVKVNMEQGSTPSNNNTHTSSLFTSKQLASHMLVPVLAMTSPMTSSSFMHDGHHDNKMANNYSKDINMNGPDNSIWNQEFLNGPICESSPSNIYHIACLDEGLHELLYPTKVPEILFSNELKMEHLPSWSDIFMPPLPPYNNYDIYNHNPKLDIPHFHQNQRFRASIFENIDGEDTIQNDFEKTLALINIHNDHSTKLNPTYHTYESIKLARFSHDVKNGGLDAHDSFQHVNNHVGTTVATTIDHPRGHSTQTSFHYVNKASQKLQKKTQSLESQPFKKDKLRERIAILQDLVSPFGKTDQASVLFEAMRCIKYLQEQVQALSSPYFKSPTTKSEDGSTLDLRSKGLCLVPFSCTLQVENTNGVDSLLCASL